MATDPNFGITLPENGQSVATLNRTIVWALALQRGLMAHDYDASGGAPTLVEGEVWHIATSPTPTGDFAGQGGKLAAAYNGGWLFADPKNGMLLGSQNNGGTHKLVYRKAGAWSEVSNL